MKEKNIAYDISLFETAEVEDNKKGNILKLPKKKLTVVHRKKVNVISFLVTSLIVTLGVTVFGILIFNQVQLAEITDKTREVSALLEESYSENTQLQMKVKEKVSPNVVEEYAKDKLGMESINPCQIEYFSLSSGDKVEKIQDGNNKSFFNSFLSLLGIS